MSIDDQKRQVGEAGAAQVVDGTIVGLGSGSTAAWFVRALARRVQLEGLALRCVATSLETAALAEELGLVLIDIDEAGEIDLTVDGADEITRGLALIKGGGAALTREKLVWEASRRCIAIVDQAKVVETLGAFALPVEVVAFAHRATARRLVAAAAHAGVAVEPRLRLRGDRPLVTDNGGLIYDLPCGAIPDVVRLAHALKPLTGVVEHGLFPALADLALVGTDKGVVRLHPAGAAPKP